MRVIKTEIDISAPKEKVWDILVDFENYPKWNPFIISIKGELKVRKRLEVIIQTGDSKKFRFQPRVTSYKKYREFSWLGSVMIYGLFDGHHVFEIKEIGNGKSRLIHRENFSGLLVPLMWKQLNHKTRLGFDQMNKSVKELAENESH